MHKILSLLALSFLLHSCSMFRASSKKSAKKHYESFFVGEQGTQYFIKPINFQDSLSEENLSLDFTFRYYNQIKDSVIINFDLKGKSIYKQLEEVNFSNKNIQLSVKPIQLLFNEKHKKDFRSRHTMKIALKDLKNMYEDPNWKISILNSNQWKNYFPTKKTKRIVNIINQDLFSIM